MPWLARQHERRAAGHERPLLPVVDVVEERDLLGGGAAACTCTHRVERRAGAGDHQPGVLPGRGRGVAVDQVVDAAKTALSTFTEEFSPYQYAQLRIMEFPYGRFAQAFAE